MAHAAGLAFLEPNSHLCLHPKFGSWLALRCALVFEGVAYTGPRSSLLMSPLSTSTEHYVQMAMKTAQRKPSIDLTEPGVSLCTLFLPDAKTSDHQVCASA